jgi:hypothetical protein
VSPDATLSVLFNEAMDARSITGSTILLRDATGNPVPMAVAYDAAANMANCKPSNPLSTSTTYTLIVKGGVGGVADVAGNNLSSDYIWTFMTLTFGAKGGAQGGRYCS